jgi:hypothetical protein
MTPFGHRALGKMFTQVRQAMARPSKVTSESRWLEPIRGRCAHVREEGHVVELARPRSVADAVTVKASFGRQVVAVMPLGKSLKGGS